MSAVLLDKNPGRLGADPALHPAAGGARPAREGDQGGGQYGARAPIRSGDEIGELATAFNEMTTALAEKERTGQALRRKILAAHEDERRRIARELHDETGQALTSLIAGLGALEVREQPSGGGGADADLRRMAERTLQDVHDLAVTLRPSVLDDVGLAAAVERHCATVGERSGIFVSFRHLGLDGSRLPAEMEVAIYRLIQEALTNAVRHGGARKVQILLEREAGRVLLLVADDGRGFAGDSWRSSVAKGGHLGLLGMEEIVHFYKTRDVPAEMWPPAEVPENVNTDELGNLGLTPGEEADLVAFMRTLSDGYVPGP